MVQKILESFVKNYLPFKIENIKFEDIRGNILTRFKKFLDENVDADFFNEEEVYTTNLKSKVAEIEEDRDYLIAIGDVVVVSDSGVTLFTDTLSWDNVKERVFTDDRVTFITEQQDTLYGIGFESDVELNNWKILKPTGIFHDEK